MSQNGDDRSLNNGRGQILQQFPPVSIIFDYESSPGMFTSTIGDDGSKT